MALLFAERVAYSRRDGWDAVPLVLVRFRVVSGRVVAALGADADHEQVELAAALLTAHHQRPSTKSKNRQIGDVSIRRSASSSRPSVYRPMLRKNQGSDRAVSAIANTAA